MFARLRAALRPRPVPALTGQHVAVLAEPAEFIDVLPPLPSRTPGLHTARRHTWTATSHALAALRDADGYADARMDPARSEEARVRHVAALHQIDAALAELAAARRSLAEGGAR